MGVSWAEEGNLIRMTEAYNKENTVTSPWRGDGKKDDPDLEKQPFIPSCTCVACNSAALGLGEK